MQSPAHLFDRSLYRRRLARALAGAPADFLAQRARDELFTRLSAVRREFPTALDVCSPAFGGDELERVTLGSTHRLVVRATPIIPKFEISTPLTDSSSILLVDEECLPFAPESFSLATSILALQWVNDLPGVLTQIRRILVPDGLFLACLIGGESLCELRASFLEAEAEILGGASLRVSPFADLRDMGALLQRAGFALPVADAERLIVRYASPFALIKDLRAMGAGNCLKTRRPLPRKALMRAAEIYAKRYTDPDGRIRATFEFIWLSGWAPHESQQQPAKRGSAQMSLAEAVRRPQPLK